MALKASLEYEIAEVKPKHRMYLNFLHSLIEHIPPLVKPKHRMYLNVKYADKYAPTLS